jgi:GDP-L-fucose synthase
MQADEKIYVAGHRGMVGAALVRALRDKGYDNIVTRTHAELDLTHQEAVNAFFEQERPAHVFLAAARVGGIHANNTYRADFIYQNLMIEANVIHAAHRHGTRKLLFLGSSCIYPKLAPQPLREEYLLSGPLESTNEPYAVAKIAGLKMCESYNRQFGADFFGVMPTNLYGTGDNYDLENSHVVPALLRKMHEAKIRDERSVVVWGSGTPRREFLFSDDLADACVFLMEHYGARHIGPFINVGVGEDLSIRELATRVAAVVGYDGALVFDESRPDGTPRKLLDVSRLRSLGWQARTPLDQGLQATYADFLQLCDADSAQTASPGEQPADQRPALRTQLRT